MRFPIALVLAAIGTAVLSFSAARASAPNALDATGAIAELRARLDQGDPSQQRAALADLLKHHRSTPLDDGVALAEQAIALLPHDANVPRGQEILNHASWAITRSGKADRGLELADRALAVPRASSSVLETANAHYMRGVALYYMSRAGEAIDAAEQALLHFRDLRDRPQQASVHRLLGAVHRSQSNYAASLEHQTGALDIGKALRDPRMIASAQNNIALIFWELDSFERAYNSFLNVVEYYEAAGPRRNWLQALSNLSLVLIEMGRPDEALTHLLRGQEYAYEDAEVRTRAFYDSNIAFAHEELGDLESAFLYYDRALKVRESVNDLWGQTRVLGAIGGLWWNSRGEADRALPYLERALEKGREAGAAHEQAKVLQLLSEVYEALQQPVRALEVLRQSNTLLESLDVTAVEQQLKVMESAREVAEADLRLSQQARRQNLLTYVVLTMVLSVTGLAVYSRSRAALLARVRASRDALEASANSLRESEQRYRRLFDDAVVPKFLVERESGRLLDVNAPGLALCGTTSERLLEHGADGVSPQWLADALLQASNVQLDPLRIGARWTSSAGERRSADVWLVPVALDGRECVLATVHDATEVRRQDDERVRVGKLESLGVLAGGMAHDFNNALTAVLGYVNLARNQADEDGRIGQLLSAAEKSIDQCTQMTAGLKVFAKGGAPRRERHDIALQLFKALDVTKAAVSVDIDLSTAADLWSSDIDVAQFHQLIGNLVLNAQQAMDGKGSVRVRATNHVAEQALGPGALPGHYVRIDVADSGGGIADEIQDRVMDPYFSTRHGSTGLGLATAFAIATRHDGWLEFETRAGEGTTFHVYLPAQPSVPALISSDDAGASGNPARILVMDDEPAIRQMYDDALTDFGCRVVTADDGRAAVDLFASARRQDDPFDLVIMDLTVPGGTGGREAMARIRQIDPSVLGIVASGYSNDPVMAKYEDFGFAAAVHKPFSLDALADAVRSALGASRI